MNADDPLISPRSHYPKMLTRGRRTTHAQCRRAVSIITSTVILVIGIYAYSRNLNDTCMLLHHVACLRIKITHGLVLKTNFYKELQ